MRPASASPPDCSKPGCVLADDVLALIMTAVAGGYIQERGDYDYRDCPCPRRHPRTSASTRLGNVVPGLNNRALRFQAPACSTPLSLQVSISDAMAAHRSPPPSAPPNNAFFRYNAMGRTGLSFPHGPPDVLNGPVLACFNHAHPRAVSLIDKRVGAKLVTNFRNDDVSAR